MKIGLIDYGAGNLLSVKKALTHLGAEVEFIKSPEDFRDVAAVVLPGVGAFGAAMKSLEPIKESLLGWINDGRPYLGICLGLQLLFEWSEESPGESGLSVLRGKVLRFNTDKVPQIGWNRVYIVREHPVFKGILNGEYFYFLHGYYVVPEDREVVISETEYSIRYVTGVARGNLVAVQFHPEKSGGVGLQFLSNWLEFVATRDRG